MKIPFTRAALAAALLAATAPALADGDIEARLAAMEARMNALEAENKSLKAQLATTETRLEDTSEQVEKVASATASTGSRASWAERTRVGGYGEIHYNNLDGSGGASDLDRIDFHRFVLFVNHEFSDRIRLFSELELEHSIAGEGKVGEIELEQAYVEFDLNDSNRARAGLFLLPVGILNETHEPATFYGVERNPVESNIIPSTWWAGGAGLAGEIGGGFSYDLAMHEGLKTAGASKYAVRSGRQKTGNATASDFAGTARLKWTGLPGVELAGSVQYQSDMTQGADLTAGSATLVETHAIINKGPFGLRALYARWDLDGTGPAAIGADVQQGWYVEPSFRLSDQWGLFARYNAWDNQAGLSGNTGKQQTDFGVNYWPHPDVVIKADYQRQDNDDGKNQDGFNLGLGFQF